MQHQVSTLATKEVKNINIIVLKLKWWQCNILMITAYPYRMAA
jgi:hypothetical protein